ncbi:hypothetical protein Acr_28g0004710 [Actinidia rufa]|uniref:Uncharacterized protein n=1 Tax=Actinidia rufa TaxID=165716 RepID=A0A7J0H9L2_9ERIC|nr:hypothetical protein Acr_28g0004710 [Actinidia rufa]
MLTFLLYPNSSNKNPIKLDGGRVTGIDKEKGQDVSTSHKRSSKTGKSLAVGSASTPTSAPDFWNPELSIEELGCCVTHDDNSRDFEACLVVAQAAMLPRDVTEFKKEDGVMVCSKSIMKNLQREKKGSYDLMKAQTKATILEGELRKEEEDLIVATEELKKKRASTGSHGPIYQQELDVPPNHLVWSATRPPVAYLDPCPDPYSPIFPPGFDKEEYFNCPTERDDNTQVGRNRGGAEKEVEKEPNRVVGLGLNNLRWFLKNPQVLFRLLLMFLSGSPPPCAKMQDNQVLDSRFELVCLGLIPMPEGFEVALPRPVTYVLLHRVMNEINAGLVQHLAITNPPPPAAFVPEVTKRPRRSHRLAIRIPEVAIAPAKGIQLGAITIDHMQSDSPNRRYGNNRLIVGDIQTIHGRFGSKECSSSSRKRHAREANGRVEEEVYNLSEPLTEVYQSITFTNDDLRSLHLPHDDALLISATIANFNVQRILIDNGHSADKMKIG